jgi:predicted deacylase
MEPKPFVRPPIVLAVEIDALEPGLVHRMRVVMTENATGNETLVPVIVLRAEERAPVVGIVAAVHGNELNGIRVIHRLVDQLASTGLRCGTVVAVPIVNVPGYSRQERDFEDGVDLNRIMPGSPNGNESALYAHRFVDRVVRHCDYLLDLHTASAGRANSLYVRANMRDADTAQMARLVAPQIIVHCEGGDGTLRGAAERLGARAVTVEVGGPQRLQRGMVRAARHGVVDVLAHLGMVGDVVHPSPHDVVECERSYWMHTDRGGILTVLPDLCEWVEQDQVVARLRNVWGDVVREYAAPDAGVVVGKSTNPTARAGARILHLGVAAGLR